MRIGFVVNVMGRGKREATTYRLAAECLNGGHEVWIMSTGSFSCNRDDTLGALARTVPPGRYKSGRFLDTISGEGAIEQWLTLDELDILLLRSNPSVQLPWAQVAGVHFGRLAMRRGVLVLNDPNGLATAMNKLYLQTFPEAARPRALVTRTAARIEEFARKEGTIILKPLQGSGGKGVFLVRSDDVHNLQKMIGSLSRDGYVIAQQYLPAAAEGDTRLFLLNGVPLRRQGKYAAVRRVRTGDDIRSNVHAGGRPCRAEVNDAMLELAEMVRPRLVEDGMFLVGLDIVGDKLMEINVFSPGGLDVAEQFEKVDFTGAVIEALERKIRYVKSYQGNLSNVELATL